MVNAILSTIRRQGLRITAPRTLVARELSIRPRTAQEIFDRIKKKHNQIDLVSVYRTLQTFTALGLVREVSLGDGYTRYEKNSDGHHHHLICTVCGSVEDIELPEASLLTAVRKRTDFSVTRHMLEFFGTCSLCQKRTL